MNPFPEAAGRRRADERRRRSRQVFELCRRMKAKLAAACPNGIDVCFQNVGGAVWQAVLPLLNKFARVPVSGLIAHYVECLGCSCRQFLLPLPAGSVTLAECPM